MEDDSQRDDELSEYPDDFTESDAKLLRADHSVDSSSCKENNNLSRYTPSPSDDEMVAQGNMRELSRKLAIEIEKNVELSRALDEMRSERDAMAREGEVARAAPSVGRGESALSEGRSVNDEAETKSYEKDEKTLRARLRRTDEELSKTKAELEKKKIAILQRGRADKDHRIKVEQEANLAAKKVSALSDHVEKLMVHLKHEVASKVSSQDQLRRAEKEIEALRHRNSILLNRNNSREQLLLELKEGSKILEDQLRLMDRRYLELRSKLDWTRQRADRQVKKAKATASTLRAKWAAVADPDQQNILLDDIPVDKMKKPRIVKTPVVETRRERPRTDHPFKTHRISSMATSG